MKVLAPHRLSDEIQEIEQWYYSGKNIKVNRENMVRAVGDVLAVIDEYKLYKKMFIEASKAREELPIDEHCAKCPYRQEWFQVRMKPKDET
jgi:hypothetical protein